MTKSPKIAGFSLVELLVVITVLGIILFFAFPNIVQVKSDSEKELAKARAETLNLAGKTSRRSPSATSKKRAACASSAS